MSEKQKLSDVIIDAGEDFQIDAMEDYDDRVKSGEFANKTTAQIREIYLDEAIHEEEQEEMDEVHRRMNEREEREFNGDE